VDDARAGGLLRWQWSLYPGAHRDRRNLLLHLFTNPLFLIGTCALLGSPLLGMRAAVGGVVLLVLVIAIQGRGHKKETTAPARFRGPGDVLARFFAEQWITFPRYVFSGGFAAAWRAAAKKAPAAGVSE
jgi:hypothetical protein